MSGRTLNMAETNGTTGLTVAGNNASQPSTVLPKEIHFTEDGLVSVVAYSVLFVIAAIGNLTVFITLFREYVFSFVVRVSVPFPSRFVTSRLLCWPHVLAFS